LHLPELQGIRSAHPTVQVSVTSLNSCAQIFVKYYFTLGTIDWISVVIWSQIRDLSFFNTAVFYSIAKSKDGATHLYQMK